MGSRKKRKIAGIVVLVLGIVGLGGAMFVHMAMQDMNASVQSNPELQLRLAFDREAQAQMRQMQSSAMTLKYGAAGLGGLFLVVGIVILLTLPPEQLE